MNSRSTICFFLSLAFASVSVTASAEDGGPALTLEQIMADPDWLGNTPENAFWGRRQ